jgi:hypothetical protein
VLPTAPLNALNFIHVSHWMFLDSFNGVQGTTYGAWWQVLKLGCDSSASENPKNSNDRFEIHSAVVYSPDSDERRKEISTSRGQQGSRSWQFRLPTLCCHAHFISFIRILSSFGFTEEPTSHPTETIVAVSLSPESTLPKACGM